jgi:hypothetical protein
VSHGQPYPTPRLCRHHDRRTCGGRDRYVEPAKPAGVARHHELGAAGRAARPSHSLRRGAASHRATGTTTRNDAVRTGTDGVPAADPPAAPPRGSAPSAPVGLSTNLLRPRPQQVCEPRSGSLRRGTAAPRGPSSPERWLSRHASRPHVRGGAQPARSPTPRTPTCWLTTPTPMDTSCAGGNPWPGPPGSWQRWSGHDTPPTARPDAAANSGFSLPDLTQRAQRTPVRPRLSSAPGRRRPCRSCSDVGYGRDVLPASEPGPVVGRAHGDDEGQLGAGPLEAGGVGRGVPVPVQHLVEEDRVCGTRAARSCAHDWTLGSPRRRGRPRSGTSCRARRRPRSAVRSGSSRPSAPGASSPG